MDILFHHRSHSQRHDAEALASVLHYAAAEERCDAVTDLTGHAPIQCGRERGHDGNHHATVTGSDLHIARDGHTIRATAWQVEWRDEPARRAA